jgi:hypothetical protein
MQCWDLINRGQGISVVPPQARANSGKVSFAGVLRLLRLMLRTQPRSGGGPNIESHLESELE